MKVSYFETGRYHTPANTPGVWPMPSAIYEQSEGTRVYQGMVERIQFVEKLGFDWVSLSEHHYSPRILTPSPPLAAAYIAARVHKIKIALLGPIVSHSNPVRLAEELAMLDTMADGRLVVGLLRGTTNEALTYDLNPQESRERTDEGMELILKAWTEPQPFGWQGRHFRYRTVSVWPRPLQQPTPPTYALGTSREAGEFAARNKIGLGVSYGPFDVMGKATGYYRDQCALHGWEPTSDQIIFRANIVLAETDAAAQRAMEAAPARAPFSMGAGVAKAMLELDTRNIAGESRPASINRALPINFSGGPDTVVEQIRALHRGANRRRHHHDLGFNTPGTTDPDAFLASVGIVRKASSAAHSRHLTGAGIVAFQERWVEADGFRIRYMEAGEGPPLLHLHGAGGLRLNPAHDLFSRQFRVIGFEMPGFGEVENDRTQTMPQLASTMAAAAQALGLSRFNLMGTSFGGKTALWLTIQRPELVSALILEAPAAIRPEGTQPPSGSAQDVARRLYAHPERMPAAQPVDPERAARIVALTRRLRGPDRDAELEARMRVMTTPSLVRVRHPRRGDSAGDGPHLQRPDPGLTSDVRLRRGPRDRCGTAGSVCRGSG